jgi:hypothetical protein
MAPYTGAPFWLSPELADQLEIGLPGPHSEEDLRAAWRMFGAQITAEPHEPGVRPLGFWQFTVGRPEHLLPRPPFTGDPHEIAQARDEYALEPILYLAEQGYLGDDERLELLARAREARARVGTDRQLGELRVTPAGEKVWMGGDRTAVAIGEALERDV